VRLDSNRLLDGLKDLCEYRKIKLLSAKFHG
jgi:hypothetical protein